MRMPKAPGDSGVLGLHRECYRHCCLGEASNNLRVRVSRKNYKLTFTVFTYSGHQELLKFCVKPATNGFLVPHFSHEKRQGSSDSKLAIRSFTSLSTTSSRAPMPPILQTVLQKIQANGFHSIRLGAGSGPGIVQISSLKTSSTATQTGGFYSQQKTQPTQSQCGQNVTREMPSWGED